LHGIVKKDNMSLTPQQQATVDKCKEIADREVMAGTDFLKQLLQVISELDTEIEEMKYEWREAEERRG
jgi:hypothetical protein